MPKKEKLIVLPSGDEIRAARKVFEQVEPRGLFYRAARELVALAREEKTEIGLSEALAVLLQTWNITFYRFRKSFDAAHFDELDALLKKSRLPLESLRHRTIADINDSDASVIKPLFAQFEAVLGAVGAAKCLHLLLPSLFPLWDREIAAKSGWPLGAMGSNSDRYWCFLRQTQLQVEHLSKLNADIRDPLKALDEFNYCTYTLPRLRAKSASRGTRNG